MDTLQWLATGFAVVMQPANLFFAVLGCVLGMLIGVLPGVGPAAGTAILIPVTLTMTPTAAIIMLAAIYYGAMYGGTITSILLNMPGEAASAVTCIDGYAMAKRGRGGQALAVAAIGSFIGGTFATLGLVVLAVPLSKFALSFGPPEFFALMAVGMSLVTGLASQSLLRAMVAALLGLLLAQVGIDPVMGAPRFTFGQMPLLDGLGVVPVVMGLFGIAEIFLNVERRSSGVYATRSGSLMLSRDDLRQSAPAVARGAPLGFLLGLIPGIGAVIPTYLSYAIEKRLSRDPSRFGQGAIEGVAGPETANNAYANGAFVPLFTLGIPGAPTTAILMGALMMNGLVPGPSLFTEQPQFIWAVIASFFVGNAILLVLSLPFVPLWVAVLRIPYPVLMTIVLGLCVVGVYSLSNNVFDVGLMLVFGVVGYAMKKVDIPTAPLVLTFVIGPLMERGLRQSLEMSQGDFSILWTRPLSATLLAVAVLIVLTSAFRAFSVVRGADSEV